MFKSNILSSALSSAENQFACFWLTVSYAAYFLFLNILVHIKGGISEREEFIVFIHGWLTVPLLTSVQIFIIEKIRQKFFKEKCLFYPLLLIANVLYWAVTTWGLRWASLAGERCSSFSCILTGMDSQIPSWETGGFAGGKISTLTFILLGILLPVLNLAVLMGVKLLGRILKTEYTCKLFSDIVYVTIPFFVGIVLINYSSFVFSRFYFLLIATVLAFLSIWHKKIMEFQLKNLWLKLLNLFIILLIGFLIFEPTLPVNFHHYNHYIGPTVDLMAGKSLLVDINCQYGVLPIYFLKETFRLFPFSYKGFSLLLMILFLGQYILLFGLLRFAFKSLIFSMTALLLIIMANYFGTLEHAVGFPSIGPLRFGLPLLVLFFNMLGSRYPRAQKIFWAWEGFVVGISFGWSFETLTYVAFTFLALLFFDCLYAMKHRQRLWGMLLQRLGWVIFFTLTVHLFLMIDIYLRSGQRPHWEYYFDYVFLYSTKEFGAMLIAPWTPWVLFLLVPLISLLSIFYLLLWTETKCDPAQLRIITGLSGLAIAQLTYFLGRSHPNNLFHISIPIVFIFIFWMIYLGRFSDWVDKKFYFPLMYVCYFTLFLLFMNLLPKTVEKLIARKDNYSYFKENIFMLGHRSPSNIKVVEALQLVKKYANVNKRIGLFISPDDTVEVLMLIGKTNIFPFNYALQDRTVNAAVKRILNFKHPLKAGDYIFVSREQCDLQQRIVYNLQKQFRFVVKEGTSQQIYAIELQPL